MGANYHGETTVRCYDDCRMEGCPSHRIRLVSKHGGYYVDVWERTAADQPEAWHRWNHLPTDIHWFDALARLCANADTPVQKVESERAQLEMTLRKVRDELLSDGYHRPNAIILAIDEALGEER